MRSTLTSAIDKIMALHRASTEGNWTGNVGSATLRSLSGQSNSAASCCLESCGALRKIEGTKPKKLRYAIHHIYFKIRIVFHYILSFKKSLEPTVVSIAAPVELNLITGTFLEDGLTGPAGSVSGKGGTEVITNGDEARSLRNVSPIRSAANSSPPPPRRRATTRNRRWRSNVCRSSNDAVHFPCPWEAKDVCV